MDTFDSNGIITSPLPTTNKSTEQNQFGAILERHMELLPAEDQAVLRDARRQFLEHARGGAYLGLAVGVAFAFRSRILYGKPPIFPRLTPYVPKVGASAEENIKGAKEHAFKAGLHIRKTIAKSFGWGLTGALGGLQMGIFTGSRAGKVTLASRPGVEERGSQAIKNAIAENTKTHNDVYNFYNKPSDLIVEAEAELAEKERIAAYNNGDFTNSKDVVDSPPKSRWDALRTESTPASAWNKVRESEKVKSNSSSLSDDIGSSSSRNKPKSKVRAVGELPEPGSDEMYGDEREKGNEVYERMLQKERVGSRIGSGFN